MRTRRSAWYGSARRDRRLSLQVVACGFRPEKLHGLGNDLPLEETIESQADFGMGEGLTRFNLRQTLVDLRFEPFLIRKEALDSFGDDLLAVETPLVGQIGELALERFGKLTLHATRVG